MISNKSLTFDELREKLIVQYDIELLVELLQIEAEELLDRFEDRLMIKMLEGVFDECD